MPQNRLENLQPDGSETTDQSHLSASVTTGRIHDHKAAKDKPADTSPANPPKPTGPAPDFVSKRELEQLRQNHPGITVAEIKKLHQEINSTGTPPIQALSMAMRDSQVVGFGDVHVQPSPHNDLLIQAFPELRKAGATHLAVELPTGWQGMLDEVNSGKGLSDVDKSLIRGQYKHPDAFIDIIQAAHQNGLTVVAVDKPPIDDRSGRNKAMADNISKILKSPKNKVLFFVGDKHLVQGTMDDGEVTAAQELRNRGFRVTTFHTALPDDNSDLTALSRAVTAPVSISAANAPEIGGLTVSTDLNAGSVHINGNKDNQWNNTIFYPSGAGMESIRAELQAHAKDPVDAILDAARKNQVVAIGTLDNGNENANPPTEQIKLLDSMLPKLKANGVKTIAINMPPQELEFLKSAVSYGKPIMPILMPVGFRSEEFRHLLQDAEKSGMKIAAVGAQKNYPQPLEAWQAIAQNTEELLKQPDTGKIVLLTRTSALQDEGVRYDPNHPNSSKDPFFNPNRRTAVERLRDSNVSVATFTSMTEEGGGALGLISEVVASPTAVGTKDSKQLASIWNPDGVRVDRVDQLLFYPNHKPADEKPVSGAH